MSDTHVPEGNQHVSKLPGRVDLLENKVSGLVEDIDSLRDDVSKLSDRMSRAIEGLSDKIGLQVKELSAERRPNWPTIIAGASLLMVVVTGVFGLSINPINERQGSERQLTDLKFAHLKEQQETDEKQLNDLEELVNKNVQILTVMSERLNGKLGLPPSGP